MYNCIHARSTFLLNSKPFELWRLCYTALHWKEFLFALSTLILIVCEATGMHADICISNIIYKCIIDVGQDPWTSDKSMLYSYFLTWPCDQFGVLIWTTKVSMINICTCVRVFRNFYICIFESQSKSLISDIKGRLLNLR